MRLLPLLALCACLPPTAGSFSPPTRFGIYQTAAALDPNESLLTLGHAQPIAYRLNDSTGLKELHLDDFIELDARLRHGFSKRTEGQLAFSTLLDQAIGMTRGGLKHELTPWNRWRFAFEGGLALGIDASQANADIPKKFLVAGLDGAFLISSDRDWKVAPYTALGASITGSAGGGQAPLYAPHATIGFDWRLSQAHILAEATTVLVAGPPETAALNFLFALGVSFGIGTVKHLLPDEKIPEGLYTSCPNGQVEYDGQCYNRCPSVLNHCSSDVCIILNSEPFCANVPDLPSAPSTSPAEKEKPPVSISTPTSKQTPYEEETTLGVAPTSSPAIDNLALCLDKASSAPVSMRRTACEKALQEHPDDAFSIAIEIRLQEIAKEK